MSEVPSGRTPPVRFFRPKEYWEGLYARDFSLAASCWPDLDLSFNRWMYRLRRDVLLRTVRPWGLDWSRVSVLNVGCGTGFYEGVWSALGVRRLVGIDITERSVRELAARYPSYRFLRADVADELPGDLAGAFDVVGAFDMLYHILDDEAYGRAWANLGRALAPGGRVVVTEDFLRGDRLVAPHMVARRAEEIETAAASAGLQIVSRRPSFVVMNDPCVGDHPWLRVAWNAGASLARRGRPWGALVGAAYYGVDSVLTRLWREGPTTEIAVLTRP